MVKNKIYVGIVKPTFDMITAFILLIAFSPIIILLSIILLFHFKRSPFFVQNRPGLNCRPFQLFKLRSMQVDGEEESTSNLGRFLRATSLDELPQLFNVLIGDMSFVGPRPLLLEYIPFYNNFEAQRHNVKPGITGLAQVNGRNKIDWAKRMTLDVFYVGNVSLLLDCKVLLLTCIQLLKRDDTTYKNEKTLKFSDYASQR